jgi:hypothetical protein
MKPAGRLRVTACHSATEFHATEWNGGIYDLLLIIHKYTPIHSPITLFAILRSVCKLW